MYFLSSNTESDFVFGTSAHYKVTSGVFRYKEKAMKSFDDLGPVLFTEVPVLFTSCTTDVLTISPSPSCNRHGWLRVKSQWSIKPFPPGPSLINLMVSVDVKHHVYVKPFPCPNDVIWRGGRRVSRLPEGRHWTFCSNSESSCILWSSPVLENYHFWLI